MCMRFAYSCPFCSFWNETEAEHVKCEGSSSCRQHHYIHSHKAIHKFSECKLFTWALNNKHNKNATETTHACDREETREIRIEMRRKKTGTQTEWKLSFPAANATYTKHAGWTGEKWKMFINKCKNVNCTLVQHRSSIWMELGRTAELEPTFFFLNMTRTTLPLVVV